MSEDMKYRTAEIYMYDSSSPMIENQ